MKKSRGVRAIVWLIVALCLSFPLAIEADQTHTYTGTADAISFSYGGTFGGVRIQAASDNFSFSFSLDAESFSGSFSGDGTGFVNSSAFTSGVGASLTTTADITVGTSFAGDDAVAQSLNNSGGEALITVTLTVFGEQVEDIEVKVFEPVIPAPEMWFTYIRDEERNIIGGLFGNAGNATFTGTITFNVGLGYARGWMSDYGTSFMKGESPSIEVKPGEVVEFYILLNPLGGYTFLFPEVELNGLPIFFHVFGPSPDSKQVGQFKSMVYSWYTGYKDPEPDVDYLQVHLTAVVDPNISRRNRRAEQKVETNFWLPIQPYFPPPR